MLKQQMMQAKPLSEDKRSLCLRAGTCHMPVEIRSIKSAHTLVQQAVLDWTGQHTNAAGPDQPS